MNCRALKSRAIIEMKTKSSYRRVASEMSLEIKAVIASISERRRI